MGKKTERPQDKVDILTLNRLKVLDETGREFLISSLWKEKPAVLVFVRHFSCIACRAHVKQIWGEKEKFRRSGAQIVFIGNGEPYFIRSFKEDLGVQDATIYTDPTLKTFDACGFLRGFLNLIDPRGVKNIVELLMDGHRQGPIDKASGVHTQMGGVVALKHPGIVLYHFVSEYLGDNDPLTNLEKIADA